MQKEFNDTGLCIPGRHYMVDTSHKIEQIMTLIENGEYFTIDRPRQFGKTTTISLLHKSLNQSEEYIAVNLSFEDIDSVTYRNQESFIAIFLDMIRRKCDRLGLSEMSQRITEHTEEVTTMYQLSALITDLVQQTEKSVVLLIDEVDKSTNNQLFLDFLGMLRKKYLLRNEGEDWTFHSVILVGVHDVKTLKADIRHDSSAQIYNSPWNIAIDFEVDLSFKPDDITTMLDEYCRDTSCRMDIPAVADKLYYYTSGYPYLVSKLCKFVDERIVTERITPDWEVEDIDAAFKLIVKESYTTTLFDSLIKNLENNPELYDTVMQIVINGKRFSFTIADPVINFGHLYGILAEYDGQCMIHNRIFEQRIYAYMMSKLLRKQSEVTNEYEFRHDDRLDVALILQRFQAFMKEHYSHRDKKFLEREGRLLFLSFLKPIINGKGFDFKEPNVAYERRMDIVSSLSR
ncbi:MAG: AAA family ATPase [bacterium]|nr:AAA family ATPase [bacterium]